MPLYHSLCLISMAGILSSSGAVLQKADLTRDIIPLIENRTLQAVSIGLLQPEGAITAHVGVLSPGRPVAPDDRTLYEIGSITKVFTSLLLADAVVRGEVTLDTPISQLLPSEVVLPNEAGNRITLRMLATHTSGLPTIPVEIPADNFTNPYAAYEIADLWATLRRVKLEFEPGTKAGYSNLAVGLLGTLLARNAGTTYADLLATRITGPLEMTDTIVELDQPLRDRFAPAFSSPGKPWSPWDFKALAGAGGIRSTTADMVRFARAMLHPSATPLQKAIELAWTRQDLNATLAPSGQALGWMLIGERSTHWHNGMTGGFHAAIFVDREPGVAAIYLSNCSNPVGTPLTENLFRRAAGLPERAIPNRERPEVELTAEQLDRCTGTFRVNEKLVLVLERRGTTLFATPTGRAQDRLCAASPDTFFSRRSPIEIRFELPADGGPARTLVVKQGAREMPATRE